MHVACGRVTASLLDTVAISRPTQFCGAICTPFCFTYLLGGVTSVPPGLHARLCHAFLLAEMIVDDTELVLAGFVDDELLPVKRAKHDGGEYPTALCSDSCGK